MPEHSSEILGEKNFSPLQPPEGNEKPRRDRALRKQNVVVKERVEVTGQEGRSGAGGCPAIGRGIEIFVKTQPQGSPTKRLRSNWEITQSLSPFPYTLLPH